MKYCSNYDLECKFFNLCGDGGDMCTKPDKGGSFCSFMKYEVCQKECEEIFRTSKMMQEQARIRQTLEKIYKVQKDLLDVLSSASRNQKQ